LQELGWPLAATMQRRDGYEPADLGPFLPPVRRWLRPLRSLVTIPMLLEKKGHGRVERPKVSEELSDFAIRRLLRSTRKLLKSVTPSARNSRWSGYTQAACHYNSADHEAKQAFVRSTLDRIRPARCSMWAPIQESIHALPQNAAPMWWPGIPTCKPQILIGKQHSASA
jgi:hypothetical protein